jgi:arylamine N-acetyltransferase
VLLNDRLSLYGHDGTVDRRTLANADEADVVLRDRFGIRVPDRPAFAAAFDRAVASARGEVVPDLRTGS